MDMKKVVVTGGAGFIGSHLVDALIEKGFDVHVIDNLSCGHIEYVNKGAVLHKLDIRDLESIKPVVKGVKYVFHLAALPRVQFSIQNPSETNDVNVIGTLNVLIASKEGGVEKVIYSSSGSVYGDQSTMPLVESMVADPISPYALHKYIGELYCRLWSRVYQLPTVSLRYFNVYGSRLDPNGEHALLIGKFIKQKKEGKKLTVTGDGKQTRDFTHVSDVVQANILAAESGQVGEGEVINIGAGKNQSINKIAELVGGEVEYIPARLEPRDSLADNSKARKLLDWEPRVSIEDGIKELLK